MKPEKRKILKRWLRKVIAEGVYEHAPDWVIHEIHCMGVPIQMDAERHGSKWEWCVYLEDMYEGTPVDGKECAMEALANLEGIRTVVVNLRREECDVRIDRSSKYGNPYRIGPDGDRDDVCDKYMVYLLGRVDLLRSLEDLRGLRLGCWCKPLRCHGDILVRFLENEIPWRKVPKKLIRKLRSKG